MDRLHDTILGSESWSLSDSLSNFINKETFKSPSEMWNQDYVSKITIWQCNNYNTYIDASNGILLSKNDLNDNKNDEPEPCGWTINLPKGSQLDLQFWSFDLPVSTYA